MKQFFRKILAFILFFTIINIVLLFSVPKDKNSYLCEYNHKVELMKKIPQPRIIFIGGSSIAFGTNSKSIIDSLHKNVINFGLHAGIGIKYPVEDCRQLLKNGDIVVLQMEYENFFSGGEGEPETFLPFMVSTDWRRWKQINSKQWYNIVLGVPQMAITNLKRVIKYPFTHSFDMPTVNTKFEYVKSGFNKYGDEVSHLKYPSTPERPYGKIETRDVDKEFIGWLANIIHDYESIGATVIMMPPVCPKSRYKASFNNKIEDALNEINHPYVVKPTYMVLDDSCSFGGYHVNGKGVKQNTKHIIDVLKRIL